MPQQLLSKIDHVISLAEKDNVSTKKISALLGLLSKAYKYSCSTTKSQDKFNQHESSDPTVLRVEKCTSPLSIVKGEEEQAKEGCEHFAGGYNYHDLIHADTEHIDLVYITR